MYRKKISRALLKTAGAALAAALMCPCTAAFGAETTAASPVIEAAAYAEAGPGFDGAAKVEPSPISTAYQAASLMGASPAADAAVQAAHRRIGLPYSQAKRDSGSAVDCSSLVYWAYLEAGVNIDPAGPHTAASIAQYMEGAGKAIAADGLVPGDLVFYSFKRNGRYKNISHVAIVAEDGLCIQASATHGMVIIGPLDLAGAVAFARPAAAMETAAPSDAVAQGPDARTEGPGSQGASLVALEAPAPAVYHSESGGSILRKEA